MDHDPTRPRPTRARSVVAAAPSNETSEGATAEWGRAAESPYLTTTEAAVYLRYQSSSAVRTLKMKGHLHPAGRRGSVDLYRREDLDRFVA